MKKSFAAFLTLITLFVFPACSRTSAPQESPPPESSSAPAAKSETPSSSPELSSSTPEEAAEKIMRQISELDAEQIKELTDEYFTVQQIPEEYYSLLKPMSERVSYKIGNYSVDGDTAMVDVSVTAVDAQSAVNSVMPGAAAHIIVMQMTGKDVSHPEQILADYAAANIEWDKLPTIRTDTTLHLILGADGEWKVDASNPDNLGFLNAISGGGVEVAKNLQSFVERVVK